MIKMELKAKEAEKETVEHAEMVEPKYPWGLSLSLNNESLELLGLEKEKFEVGDEISISCITKVTGVNESESLSEETQKNINLQITEMELTPEVEQQKLAKKIYKK